MSLAKGPFLQIIASRVIKISLTRRTHAIANFVETELAPNACIRSGPLFTINRTGWGSCAGCAIESSSCTYDTKHMPRKFPSKMNSSNIILQISTFSIKTWFRKQKGYWSCKMSLTENWVGIAILNSRPNNEYLRLASKLIIMKETLKNCKVKLIIRRETSNCSRLRTKIWL